MELHSPEYKWVTTAQHKENGLHQYCTPKLNSRNCKINTVEVFIVMKFIQEEASSEMSGLELSSWNSYENHDDEDISFLRNVESRLPRNTATSPRRTTKPFSDSYFTLTTHHHELNKTNY
jgi:hypothetical protein